MSVYTKTTMFSKGAVGTLVIPEESLSPPWELLSPEDYLPKENFKRELKELIDRYPTLHLSRTFGQILNDKSLNPLNKDDEHIPYNDPDQAEVVDLT